MLSGKKKTGCPHSESAQFYGSIAAARECWAPERRRHTETRIIARMDGSEGQKTRVGIREMGRGGGVMLSGTDRSGTELPTERTDQSH